MKTDNQNKEDKDRPSRCDIDEDGPLHYDIDEYEELSYCGMILMCIVFIVTTAFSAIQYAMPQKKPKSKKDNADADPHQKNKDKTH